MMFAEEKCAFTASPKRYTVCYGFIAIVSYIAAP